MRMDTSPRYDFTGKAGIVTGGGGGMGRAIAVAFAHAGATVTIADIDEARGEQTTALAGHDGGTVRFLRTDIAQSEDVQRLIAAAVDAEGRLDFAVNAAAIEFEGAPIHECEEADFDRMIGVNLRGVFLCMKHELRAMLAGDGGAIVNIASVSGIRPQRNTPSYIASKHGVLGLTRSAAVDYAEHGIRVNAICPGAIDTPMLRSAMVRRGADEAATIARLSPLGRFGLPSEIAEAALWLCSDAASFITGSALTVDGGLLTR
jgi:NAD(P)-dependent dehydrogenase (short-subunit alcohol dehydrogenase family)